VVITNNASQTVRISTGDHLVPFFTGSATVNDWILWQKVILIATRLRNNPSLVLLALERLQNRKKPLFSASYEWLELLQSKDIEAITSILDSPDHESQRLRSSSPFDREPFIEGNETEAIHARAHLG
jgi:hypothetical protein